MKNKENNYYNNIDYNNKEKNNNTNISNNKNWIQEDEIDFEEIDQDLASFQQNEVFKEMLLKGMDLRQYAKQVNEELHAVELESVADYVQESENIVSLYNQIHSCDDVLARMQEMLLGFQVDLGDISDEIRLLQDKSLEMSVKLKNRRDVEEKLHFFLDKMVLTPEIINGIDDAEVNESYISYLIQLNTKLKYINNNTINNDTLNNNNNNNNNYNIFNSDENDKETTTTTPSNNNDLYINPLTTMAAKDIKEQLLLLKNRSIIKIREFLYNKINELKKPKTNVQVLQKNVFIKLKYLMNFLIEHSPEIAIEICNFYIETMSKILINLFRQYNINLMKYYEEIATKYDVIAVDESQSKNIFTTKINLKIKKTDPFSINDRISILDNLLQPPILVHVAQAENNFYSYEIIFRSIQQHLMNSATSEYLFIIDFFSYNINNNDTQSNNNNIIPHPKELFMQIFAKTLSLCLENLENYLFTCYDALGLLLMIRITLLQRELMIKRKIICLDSYFDRIYLLLWPRFKILLDLHIKSMKNIKLKKLGNVDFHAHYITRRYAEFLSSILSLYGNSEIIQNNNNNNNSNNSTNSSNLSKLQMDHSSLFDDLHIMSTELVLLLNKLAMLHHNNNKKIQIVFLINNYDQILSLFQERKITCDETTYFEELLAKQREKYVEEELVLSYGKLILFVQQTENLNTATSSMPTGNSSSSMTIDTSKVESIVKDFNKNWKNGIEKINANVMKYFSNFRNGMEILKQVLTQLLLYYTRFIEIVRKNWIKSPPFSNEIITTHEILYEIKKYSRSF